jgi:small acid-soluble spore protein O (minor)
MHTKDTTWQTKIMEVYIVSNSQKNNLSGNVSDEQAVRKNLSRNLDHELANEPLTPAEKHNNKKTKKRQ